MTEISNNGKLVFRSIKAVESDSTEFIKRHCWAFYSLTRDDTADALAELSNAGLIRYQEAGELWIVE